MSNALSRLLDRLSDFFSQRKGLLPLVGLALVFFNLALQVLAPASWWSQTNCLLHFGVILAITGFLIARAL
jgi:hypothetical protein